MLLDRRGHRVSGVLTAFVVASLSFVATITTASPAVAQVAPGPNPEIVESCGLDVSLLLDASGSVSSSHAVDDVRDAADAFLNALADTQSTARMLQFGTVSEELAAQQSVTTESLQQGEPLRDALDGYYDPKPPIPGDVDARRYQGGNPLDDDDYDPPSNADQYTNWDASLHQSREAQPIPTELVVFITDGDPTAFDFDQSGDPFDDGPPPDVAYRTDADQAGRDETLDRAIEEANAVKAAGSRMLAVGVGEAVTGGSSVDRLIAVSGDQVVDDLDQVDSINEIDVALVQDFGDLETFLRSVVVGLCTPSLTVRKLAQSPESAEYRPTAGWDVTVEPTVTGSPGTFEWVLPDLDPEQAPQCDTSNDALRTCPTDDDGFAAFQWSPDPPDGQSNATVSEDLQDNYMAGRPGVDDDYSCTFKNVDGSSTQIADDFSDPLDPSFDLEVDAEQIITCTIYNSYDYSADIDVVKVNDPTQVRGDLEPPGTVTSTYQVTNPGESPLANVTVVDDRCADVTFVSGDNGDDLLAPLDAETWIYQCTRTFSSPDSPTPTTVTNTVVAHGFDPAGGSVTATDDATVDVYTAGIDIVKTVDPVEVPRGGTETVTYTYTVTNTASLELADVVVTDDTASAPFNSGCANIVFSGGDDDGDDQLDPTETWIYTCTADLDTTTADHFFDLADATADPVFPNNDPAPPSVTASDPAAVTVFDPDLVLTKVADQDVVLPGTAVTYTYTLTNDGDTDLRKLGVPTPDPSDHDWVSDDLGPTGTCGPLVFTGGDDGDDGILSPDETWTYTCEATIDDDALNVAVATAETNTADPVPLIRFAPERVVVVEPAITIEKVSARPRVLDPAAPAIVGPDVTPPRPAAFTFLVSNPGDVPLADVSVSDTYPLNGDPDGASCEPQPILDGAFNVGDLNADNLLDPGETWQFDCLHDGVRDPVLTQANADPGSDPLLPAPVTDTATATGTPQLEGQTVDPITSEPATQTVEVISPSVTIDKSAAPTLVRLGAEVTYTFAVSNTGDTDLRILALADDRCPDITFASGDDNADGLLGGGQAPETWTYTCTTTVDELGVLTNTAGVLTLGPLGNVYGDTDIAEVTAFDPGIRLEKSVSDELVPAGTGVTYEFVVTNDGASPVPANDVLDQILLGDVSRPANPVCTNPEFIGDDIGNDAILSRDETWTYTCPDVIDETTVDFAAVLGLAIDDGPVAAADAARVQAFTPAIEITKTADPTELSGPGEVTYTYTVTNPGDVPLANVEEQIADDTCSPLELQSGDDDGDGLLDTPNSIFEDAADETWIFTCSTLISSDTVNTVTVDGTPVDPDGNELCDEPCDVTDTATAEVTVTETTPPSDGTSPPDGASAPSTGTRTPLAFTGDNLWLLVLIGLALLTAGAALTDRRRRRHLGHR